MTYAIANHYGSSFETEQTHWLAFDTNNKCIGHITKIAAWAVPAGIHAGFSLPNHLELYLNSNGQWAPTLENAEHLLINEPAPEEFIIKGSLMALFVPGEWAIDNGNPNKQSDYQIFRDPSGYWNAEEIEPPVLIGVSNLPDYF
jgi:hypothetical protein